MLRILGGNPVVGLVLAAVLLVVGLTSDRPVLALAGGFVCIASLVRLVSGPSAGNEDAGTRRGTGLRR
jgi:hypothetical protein